MNETRLIGDTVVQVVGQGPAVVFCHGFTTTGAFWREQIKPLSEGHKVVVINLPGHGPSPRPKERHYTMEAFVADVANVFELLGLQNVVLVGLSMGGTISQQFALKYPHLLKALVLVGATPHGLGPDVNVDNVLRAINEMGVEKSSQVVIERSFGSATSTALLNFAKNEVIQTPDYVAKEAIVSLNAADSRNSLGKIQLPTLIVCGDEDTITPPKESEALAKGIANSRLKIVKQAGHFPMLEKPNEFNQLLMEFIDSTVDSSASESVH